MGQATRGCGDRVPKTLDTATGSISTWSRIKIIVQTEKKCILLAKKYFSIALMATYAMAAKLVG